MGPRQLTRLGAVAALGVLLAACGSSAPAALDTPTASTLAIPAAVQSSARPLLDWPEFGLDPQRSDTSELATGITAANLSHLSRRTVQLAGTVDSSPIYLHQASVDGAAHDTIVVTTTYGKTIAVDANSGAILWTFTPAGYSRWAG